MNRNKVNESHGFIDGHASFTPNKKKSTAPITNLKSAEPTDTQRLEWCWQHKARIVDVHGKRYLWFQTDISGKPASVEILDLYPSVPRAAIDRAMRLHP
jgi:hypothetical protein